MRTILRWAGVTEVTSGGADPKDDLLDDTTAMTVEATSRHSGRAPEEDLAVLDDLQTPPAGAPDGVLS